MFIAALFIIDKQAMETTCVQQWVNGEIVCVCVCVCVCVWWNII